MRIFVPPIKCQGIKTKIVPFILENVDYENMGRWIEPFMGSGVVGFNARPPKAIFNDLNPHIIAFYDALKSKSITPGKVREFLEFEGENLRAKGQEHYYFIRKRFNERKDPLDFLFLSRACFNGIIRFNSSGFFNVPFCKKADRFSRAYITKIVNQVRYVCDAIWLNDWDFTSRDFQGLIIGAGKEDFLYCDPPYIGRHTDYFNSWSEEDEHKLFVSLSKTEARFILSTWHSNKYRMNPYIDKYWKHFHILTKNHFYHIGAKEVNRNPIIEALILNYEPPLCEVEKSESKQLVLLEKKAEYSARP